MKYGVICPLEDGHSSRVFVAAARNRTREHRLVCKLICQKSLNFIDAFHCYKQNCKVVSLSLAHAADADDCVSRH